MTCSCKKCGGHWTAWVLVIIGALNWGAIGVFGVDVVESLLGQWPMLLRVVYTLVGLSGLLLLVGCRCKTCSAGAMK